ncbi:MAG: hypothetical protein EAY72_10080 [Bacteroidetes bacterium]|nr:MAG: hypothetical protein EAY72_10080 [Bacteroidota bacterium]TAE72450.1 MAG: hypothetical protein EAY68_01180 [Bacteroidota bacterium]
MKLSYVSAVLLLVFSSCDTITDKTKETVNKTGEVVAKTSSEFIDGVQKGVQKTFEPKLAVDSSFKASGIAAGRVIIGDSAGGNNNLCTIYFTFDKKVKQLVTAYLMDDKNQEYGRSKLLLVANAGDAKYIDFLFDKRAEIGKNTTIVIK